MKKFNLTKIRLGLALSAQIFCQTAMAIVPYEGIYKAPMDKTFNDFSFKTYKPIYKISDKKQQDKVFEITNYFSTHTPFSLEQIDNYFHQTFNKVIESPDVYPNDYTLMTTDKSLNIQDIDFRNREGGQLFIINLKEPVCFDRDEFESMMEKQGYDAELNPPKAYFSKKMLNYQGQMSLGLANTDDRNLRCVDSLVFDTFEN